MIPGIVAGEPANAPIPPPTDPFFANVSALLHLDGADGSTVFTDQKGNTWTATGAAQIDTAESQFGGASLLNSNIAHYISTPSAGKFGYGIADFTLEFWFRTGTLSGVQIVYDQRTATSVIVLAIFLNGATLNYFAAAATQITSAAVLATNTWYHVAVSRVTNVTKMFLNGVQVGSNYADVNSYGASPVLLGSSMGGISGYVGWIDEVRVTKGTGRYSANFTPPAAAFPDA